MEIVTPMIAFMAGLGSFFSPCSLPIVPGYIMYISGFDESVDNGDDVNARRKMRRRMMFRTLSFVLGFTVVFVLFGLSASAVGKFLVTNKAILSKISGGVIIFFGLNLMGIVKPGFLSKSLRANPNFTVKNSIGAFVIGIAFGAGWTPCFGPELGAILMLAMNSDSVAQGGILLGIYSLGMAIPYFMAALFAQGFQELLSRYIGGTGMVSKIAGGIIVITGILIFTGNIQKIISLFA